MARKKIAPKRNASKTDSVLNKDFQYSSAVKHDYEIVDRACECQSICRCKQIRATVTEIDTVSIALKFAQDDLTMYCIERLLKLAGVENPDCWDVEVVSGYYGEEIGSVRLSGAEKLSAEVDQLMCLPHDAKVAYVLTKEYGYLLDSLKGLSWEVKDLPIDTLKFPQIDYSKRLDQKVVEKYRSKNVLLPQGVCREEDGHYRLVDGYHRCTANNHGPKIRMICGFDPFSRKN